jgi:outer membrane scaffolding protein for murein synthesis (MipA/OmpV family)
MNSEYAEANYSVNYQTEQLNVFKAESGMHDVYASVTTARMFSERLGMTLMGKGTYLLSDAADSPLIESTFQPSGGMFCFYRF